MAKQICLIDASKCIGCRGCQVACKQWNQLPAADTTFEGSYENPPALSSTTWMRIMFREYENENSNGKVDWLMSKQGCMHCSDAACMQACPAGAIYRTEFDTVMVDELKCIGCNYCAAACPFDVIGFDRLANKARKCTFCLDRLENGLKPACATACPSGSIEFGDSRELISKAQSREAELKAAGKTNATIYGLDEVDGTGMLYVLADKPEKYGFPADPQVPIQTRIWNTVYAPLRVFVVIAVAFGLWVNRAQSKKVEEGKSKTK
ncbi:MAG: 4Fe-4S dicluster domain-containing protein [Bacillota bacterium]